MNANPRKKLIINRMLEKVAQVNGKKYPIYTEIYKAQDREQLSGSGDIPDFTRTLTIDYNKVDTNVTDFPIYIYVSGLDESHILNDGEDVEVYDSEGNQVPFELDFYANGVLHGWAKLPAISSSENTDFEIRYGLADLSQPARDAEFGSENVWESSFIMVMHMQDVVANTSIKDSTSNELVGTIVDGESGNDVSEIDGLVGGKAQRFQVASYGAPCYIRVDDAGDKLNPSDVTVMVWFKIDGNGVAISRGGTSESWYLLWHPGSAANLTLRDSDNNVIYLTSQSGGAGSGTLRHLIATYGKVEGTPTDDIFEDGVKKNHTGGGGTGICKDTDTKTVKLGQATANNAMFDGDMYEVQILNTIKADAWYTTLFNSQNHRVDPFYSIGEEGENEGGGAAVSIAAIKITDGVNDSDVKTAKWHGLA